MTSVCPRAPGDRPLDVRLVDAVGLDQEGSVVVRSAGNVQAFSGELADDLVETATQAAFHEHLLPLQVRLVHAIPLRDQDTVAPQRGAHLDAFAAVHGLQLEISVAGVNLLPSDS